MRIPSTGNAFRLVQIFNGSSNKELSPFSTITSSINPDEGLYTSLNAVFTISEIFGSLLNRFDIVVESEIDDILMFKFFDEVILGSVISFEMSSS